MLFLARYYFWINVFGFSQAFADKAVATILNKVGFKRVSENTLLLFAAAGAFPGQSAAFIIFHHKTRKRKQDYFNYHSSQ